MPSKNAVVYIGDLHVMRVKLLAVDRQPNCSFCRFYIVEVFMCISCMVRFLCVLNILSCSKNF